MKYDIVTVGFPMVEIMRTRRGVPFDEPGEFLGPYPSADTCIMLDVAARLGKRCCMLGTRGSDDFDDIIAKRLRGDGVDLDHIRRVEGKNTILVFVRYEQDGTREYLNYDANAAIDAFCEDDISPAVIAQARWVHISGEVVLLCSGDAQRRAMLKLLSCLGGDTKMSLDPNFYEWNDNVRELLWPFVERADLILPSEGEAATLLSATGDETACRTLAAQGKIVAYKRGAQGCDIYMDGEVHRVEAYRVEEVDPTGCGDSFCAGFLTGLLEGMTPQETGRLANAAGALQATRFGPMEGAMPRDEVEAFIAAHSRKRG